MTETENLNKDNLRKVSEVKSEVKNIQNEKEYHKNKIDDIKYSKLHKAKGINS